MKNKYLVYHKKIVCLGMVYFADEKIFETIIKTSETIVK